MFWRRRPSSRTTRQAEAIHPQLPYHSQYYHSSVTKLIVLVNIIIMLSFCVRTCRGSRLFFGRHSAFIMVAPSQSSGGISANMLWNRRLNTSGPFVPSRRVLCSSLAQFEYHQEDENDGMQRQPQRNLRRHPRPSLPPPPRARRPPPTLDDSNIAYDDDDDDLGGSNIYPEFPSHHVVSTTQQEPHDEDSMLDDYYDPNAENPQAYGFFTTHQKDYETTEMDEVELNDEQGDDEEAMYDEPFPPVSDTYFQNQHHQEEDVPNPHNYWDGDTDSNGAIAATPSTNTPLKAEKSSSNKSDAVTMPLVEHEEEENVVDASLPPPVVANAANWNNQQQQEDETKPHNYRGDNDADETTISKSTPMVNEISSKGSTAPSPLPKPSMPPRADFASRPPPNEDHRNDVYVQASSGNAITSQAELLTMQLKKLEQEIYAQNNHEKFNIHSPKQVSIVLFGKEGQSTNKETLEAMGGSGRVMADLILQHRSLARRISRLGKRQTDKSNGTLVVQNISASARPFTPTRKRNESNDASHNDQEVVEGDPLLLVDASAYIWRAYYSMPPLHRKDGMPVGAVLGFCNMLNRLVLSRMLEGERPRLVLVFDSKGKTFRHDLYDEYKANRKECPMDLIPQFDLIREAAEAYGIQQIEASNFEADDVIATLATMALKEGVDANILSGDKDLMQLITPQDMFPSIQMVDPMTMSRVSHDVVVSKWGVTPDKLGDVLALAGDSADNIPGVPGIGPKIAASLITEYGSLDELLDQVDHVQQKARREKLKDNVGNARLSRALVELERELPIEKMTFPENITTAAELRMAPMDGERLLAFYKDMGLNDLRRRVEARLNQKQVVRSAQKYNNRRKKAEIPKPDDYKDVPF